jgi:histidinol-phosphate aminotransferase
MERREFLKTGALGAGSVGALSVLPVGWRPHNRDVLSALEPAHQTDVLRLNSNENSLGLAPSARQAIIDDIVEANRYPRAARGSLVEALSDRHDVPAERLVLGNGSTEVLQMSVQALGAAGAPLVLADPTFEDVPWYSRPIDYTLERVPLRADFSHDLERMREIADGSDGTVLVYVCNPNNPTGTLTPSAELDEWIGSASDDTYFLVDEAYYDYVDDSSFWSCIPWTASSPNVIVVRTFSKIYGMAGMRLGYGIAHPETAGRLREYIGRNNANQLALVAALASLADPDMVPRSLEANNGGRRVLHECLDELNLPYLPSHTNFVMHRIKGGLDSYRRRMSDAGIRVGRPFPPMLDYNRLSLGTPEEMGRFVETLRDFRKRDWV